MSARKGRPLTILAIGSSSTEGVAASSPDRSYPARLAATLHNGYNLDVEVRNAGVGGETADVTLTRLKAALATGWADLVIWQVGTNDALRKLDERRFQMALDEGLAAAKAQSTPLILMDQQLMRAHAQDVDYARYVATVDLEGAKFNAPVLGRYAEMKKLSEHAPKIWASLLSPDGVHMNDLGYACLARALAGPIARATARGNAAVR